MLKSRVRSPFAAFIFLFLYTFIFSAGAAFPLDVYAAVSVSGQEISQMQAMDRAPEALTGPQILDTPIAENAPFQESFTVEDLQALILSTPNASEVLQQLQHLPGFDTIPQFLQGIQIFTSDGEEVAYYKTWIK